MKRFREWIGGKMLRAALVVMGACTREELANWRDPSKSVREHGGGDDGDYDGAVFPAVTMGPRAHEMLEGGKRAPRKTGPVVEPPLRGSLAERRMRAARR